MEIFNNNSNNNFHWYLPSSQTCSYNDCITDNLLTPYQVDIINERIAKILDIRSPNRTLFCISSNELTRSWELFVRRIYEKKRSSLRKYAICNNAVNNTIERIREEVISMSISFVE